MRSVILKPVHRCPDCQIPPRWCICPVAQTITTPLQIDLLSHPRELNRPSSTGNLIKRVIKGSRQIIWDKSKAIDTQTISVPGRDLLLLHPDGKPLPSSIDASAAQFMLLDGYWNEAKAMSHALSALTRDNESDHKANTSQGQFFSLPMSGPSRYWLRGKQDGERYSTAEALIFLLQALGLTEASEQLQIQFDLHVYGGLRARGRKDLAEQFLEHSAVSSALPDFIHQLNNRRARHRGD